jgi:hypothetical protein
MFDTTTTPTESWRSFLDSWGEPPAMRSSRPRRGRPVPKVSSGPVQVVAGDIPSCNLQLT